MHLSRRMAESILFDGLNFKSAKQSHKQSLGSGPYRLPLVGPPSPGKRELAGRNTALFSSSEDEFRPG
jgi:hypothetical protein